MGHTGVDARSLGAVVSALLDAVGEALARATGLTATQARGTVRLVLKERGLDVRIARKADYLALVGEPLREALEKRHVRAPSDLADMLARVLEPMPELDDAYDLFRDID